MFEPYQTMGKVQRRRFLHSRFHWLLGKLLCLITIFKKIWNYWHKAIKFQCNSRWVAPLIFHGNTITKLCRVCCWGPTKTWNLGGMYNKDASKSMSLFCWCGRHWHRWWCQRWGHWIRLSKYLHSNLANIWHVIAMWSSNMVGHCITIYGKISLFS